jgi:hypothetical protein
VCIDSEEEEPQLRKVNIPILDADFKEGSIELAVS